ncbi:uncharacterized protein LOC120462526 isoform X2 [Pimephales promelas]|uniref:uncharacterized protein LOC120462526 isoform X2 n=1 Tax=Pimephales promelas TaxID=90988 RepID=UPI0019555E26|nr:uncharacterized protein LOC120462526 isoform X2 [Pimephales promelas]
MESYEHFYSRTLKTLCDTHCSTAPPQQRALCNIHFHGRRLLEPVLSEDQRVQVCEDRRKAMERESRRHTHTLLQRVQDILNNIHSAASSTPDPSTRSVTPGQNQSLKRETLRLLNQRMASDDESTLASLSLSLTGSYAQLPCPQPSRSPDTHRARRPPTHPAGNILISRPVSECELRASASEHPSESGDNKAKPGSAAASAAPSGAERNCSGSTDGQLSIITCTHSSLRSGAARAGPLNRSYDVENPSPSLSRPQISVTEQTAGQRDARVTGSPVSVGGRTKRLCRLTAVARGFLTRRLLHTEKITHLRKTVQDSRAFIHQLKTVSVSHQDLTLQQRVTAQLRSALQDVHQIFFIWPLRDRLHLMQQDRERRRERTLREMKTDGAGNTRTLSSATRKTLDRKGQRILQCRLGQNTSCSPPSALKKRDGCVGARQHSLQRKHLSLG